MPPARERTRKAPAELVFLNGTVLRQVEARSPHAGSFSVGADPALGRGLYVSVRPPEDPDDDGGDNVLEVGVRDHGLMASGRRNVVVRGLFFQHAANPAGAPTLTGERPSGLVFSTARTCSSKTCSASGTTARDWC